MLSIKARPDGRQLIFPVVWALWEPLVLLFSLVQRCNSSGLLLPVLDNSSAISRPECTGQLFRVHVTRCWLITGQQNMPMLGWVKMD